MTIVDVTSSIRKKLNNMSIEKHTNIRYTKRAYVRRVCVCACARARPRARTLIIRTGRVQRVKWLAAGLTTLSPIPTVFSPLSPDRQRVPRKLLQFAPDPFPLPEAKKPGRTADNPPSLRPEF